MPHSEQAASAHLGSDQQKGEVAITKKLICALVRGRPYAPLGSNIGCPVPRLSPHEHTVVREMRLGPVCRGRGKG